MQNRKYLLLENQLNAQMSLKHLHMYIQTYLCTYILGGNVKQTKPKQQSKNYVCAMNRKLLDELAVNKMLKLLNSPEGRFDAFFEFS